MNRFQIGVSIQSVVQLCGLNMPELPPKVTINNVLPGTTDAEDLRN